MCRAEPHTVAPKTGRGEARSSLGSVVSDTQGCPGAGMSLDAEAGSTLSLPGYSDEGEQASLSPEVDGAVLQAHRGRADQTRDGNPQVPGRWCSSGLPTY